MTPEIIDPRGRPLRRTPRVLAPRDPRERIVRAPAGLGHAVRGGGALGPVPTVAGCAAWYRADTTNPNTNENVTATWPDKLGNAGRDLVNRAGGGALRPIRSLSGYTTWNGHPTEKFDGVTYGPAGMQALTFGTALVQPLTIYVAFYEASGSDASNVIFDGSTSGARCLLNRSDTVPLGFNMFAGGTALTSPGSYPVGNRYLACCVFNGASSALYINAVGTAAVSGNPGTSGLVGLTIGARYATPDTFLKFRGDIPEVAVYSGAHDLAARSALWSYFGGLYPLSLS